MSGSNHVPAGVAEGIADTGQVRRAAACLNFTQPVRSASRIAAGDPGLPMPWAIGRRRSFERARAWSR